MIQEHFEDMGGVFIRPSSFIADRLEKVKAIVFDWDGVFHSGAKNADGSSTFSEIDSMGVNLLRFALYLRDGAIPPTAIFTGEINPTAQAFATREHFTEVQFKAKEKVAALNDFCATHQLKPEEIAFVFDDVLDLGMAAQVGLRIMVGRLSSSMLLEYVQERELAEYLTASDAHEGAVREFCELAIALMDKYEEVVDHRVSYSETYKTYWNLRQSIEPRFIDRSM